MELIPFLYQVLIDVFVESPIQWVKRTFYEEYNTLSDPHQYQNLFMWTHTAQDALFH